MPAAISVRRPGRGTVHAAVRLARLGSRSGRGRRGGRASSRLAVAAVRCRGSGGGGRSARVVAPEGAFLEVARLRCRAAMAAVLSSSRSESRVNGSASSSSLSPSSMSNGFRLGDLDRGRGASSRLAGAASCDRRRSISAVARSIARPAARSSADSPCSCSRCPQSRSCASCWASIGRQYARNLCIARRNWVHRAHPSIASECPRPESNQRTRLRNQRAKSLFARETTVSRRCARQRMRQRRRLCNPRALWARSCRVHARPVLTPAAQSR
jgi:hypothetical protein